MIIDERVRTELAATTRFGDIRLLGETDSTNRVVAELAAGGAAEGIVVVADRQTAGRGRLDRTWEAERGAALLVSLLLRPAGLVMERWHLVTAAVGLAAREACRSVAAVDADLKWPNDLLWRGDKLAGILAESTSGALVVGMGLNVHAAPAGAAWLDAAAGRRIGRAAFLHDWLVSLEGMLDRWDVVADRYRQECSTLGRRVAVEQQGSRLVGTAEAIDEDGRLVVRPDEAGSVPVAVSAGDVIHVRPAGGAREGSW